MTKIKICGITNLEDAQLAEAHGADYLGFIFAKDSPRCVSITTVTEIISKLHQSQTVGVFVEQTDDEIKSTLQECGLTFAQVYREVSLPSTQMIQCMNVAWIERSENPGISIPGFSLRSIQATFILFDTYDPDKKGGTGKTFNWDLLPKDLSRTFVAGGINEKNVEKLITLYQPYGIDLSSSVEAHPGKKDPEKLVRFLKKAKKL